jgi:RimJ/RimL family protein N-acetyltransferase
VADRWDELRTDRLLLRHWRQSDREPFAAMNADPDVMRHFPAPLDAAASDAFADRVEAHLEARGWGLWAVELLQHNDFIGFVGLTPVPDDLPSAPAVEIGWRLAAAYWGNGYAPEAGRAALRVAFEGLHLPEVVSFTTTLNTPSRRVMSKLGLRHHPERDFDHPRCAGWHGQRHVLYAMSDAEWGAREQAPAPAG